MADRRALAWGLAALALAGLVTFALLRDAPGGERPALSGADDAARGVSMDLAPGRVEGDAPRPLDGLATDVAPSGDLASSDAPDAPTTGELEIRARFADGRPAPGVTLTLVTWAIDLPRAARPSRRTDREGLARYLELPPGTFAVYSDRGDEQVEGEIVPGERLQRELVLAPGRTVRGLVLDADGRPVPDADVWLSDYGNPFSGAFVARSDGGGAFAIEAVGVQRYVGARKPPWQPSGLHWLDDDVDLDAPVVLRLGEAGASLAGSVRDEAGRPVVGAALTVGEGWRGTGGDAPPPPQHALSDRDGAFAWDGLPPGSTNVDAQAPGFAPLRASVQLALDAPATLELVLRPGCRVTGLVLDAADGAPLADAWVSSGRTGAFDTRRTQTDAQGRFALDDLPADRLDLRADHRAYLTASAHLSLDPDAPCEQRFELVRGGTIRGRVLDAASGEPSPDWIVAAATPDDESLWDASCRPDADGAFVLEGLGQGPFSVSAVRLLEAGFVPGARLRGVRPGGEPLELRVVTPGAPGVLLGALRDGHDRAPSSGWLSLVARTTPEWTTTTRVDGEGRFRFDGVPAGESTLTVHVPGAGLAEPLGVRVESGVTTDLGVLRLRVGGTLRVRVHPREDVDTSGLRLRLVRPDTDSVPCAPDADGWLSEPAAPGRWDLVVSGPEIANELLPVDVVEDLESLVDVDLRRGVRQSFELGDAVLGPGQFLPFTIERAGRVVVRGVFGSFPDAPPRAFACLAPGPHVLVLAPQGEAERRVPFEVGRERGPTLVVPDE
ncbi:MAG: carboxypeptidase regulatory-like domain-containing protein [Planctomycetes bacterium]|nr:carboxypeptidase regulatory-like domain-containing protein [Planctomycetota bacterium]